MLEVICKTCLAASFISGGDVHESLSCPCCPEDHHHGHAASACPKTHEGPCWNPPDVPVRPDGCTVCRPLMIRAAAGVTPATGA